MLLFSLKWKRERCYPLVLLVFAHWWRDANHLSQGFVAHHIALGSPVGIYVHADIVVADVVVCRVDDQRAICIALFDDCTHHPEVNSWPVALSHKFCEHSLDKVYQIVVCLVDVRHALYE